MKYMESKRK